MLFTVLRFPEAMVHGQATIKKPTARFEPVVSRDTPGFESWRLNQLAKDPIENYVAPGMAIDDEHCPQDKYDGGHVTRLWRHS